VQVKEQNDFVRIPASTDRGIPQEMCGGKYRPLRSRMSVRWKVQGGVKLLFVVAVALSMTCYNNINPPNPDWGRYQIFRKKDDIHANAQNRFLRWTLYLNGQRPVNYRPIRERTFRTHEMLQNYDWLDSNKNNQSTKDLWATTAGTYQTLPWFREGPSQQSLWPTDRLVS